MADTKISGLPASTVPLAGTEVLPIVQSSTTKQVSIANVTAGRAVSALSVTATADTTPSSSLGAFNYGTLSYADVNHLATFQTSVASYAQVEIQNTSTDPAASSDMVVGNSLTTASTYYGDFGMNSSGWAGSAPFNTANNVYLTATSASLALGTTTANAIRFATNSAEVARMFSSGGVSIGNSTDPGATNLSVTGAILAGGNTYLYSDAANILAQRNSTNAQIFRLYGTYTDSSNYERLTIDYNATNAGLYTIAPQNLGTGSARNLAVGAGTGQSVVIYANNTISTSVLMDSSNNFKPYNSTSTQLGTASNLWLTTWTAGFSAAIATKTANYTAVTTDRTILVDATSGAITITLLTAVNNQGRYYTVKKIDSSANIVTVATTSSQTIDGITTKSLLTQYSSVQVQSNNANWFIV